MNKQIVATKVIMLAAIMTNLPKLEFGEVEATEQAEQIKMVQSFLRNKILRQFNISEVAKTPVIGGGILFNGNATRLKLPKVKMNEEGEFLETLPEYYERCKPEISRWLRQSMQNSRVTIENVLEIAV